MKKALVLLLALSMVLCFFGCGDSDTPEETETDTYEVAMITDVGTIDDKSFNQGTWEGVEEFAMDNDLTYKYYQPTEDSTDARLEQIDLAVTNGAKVIATPGYMFEDAIYIAQDKYPDVMFILIDGNPHNADYSVYETKDNVVGIVFAEQEAGYLAGYAAVMEGYTKLGFMGGMAVPAVMRFGYGYVQGANDAAAEMDIDIEMKYHYTGGFSASPDIQTKAAGWYSAGTEVIFSCGGSIGDSVMAAAEASDAKTIGVDVDQSAQSDTVITSAMKGLKVAVMDALELYLTDEFPGGEAWVLTAKDDAVGLPMENSLFETFTQEDYDALYAKLVADEVELPDDSIELATDLVVENTMLELVE